MSRRRKQAAARSLGRRQTRSSPASANVANVNDTHRFDDLINSASELKNCSRFDQALELLTRARQQFPDASQGSLAWALALEGEILHRLGKLAEASAVFRRMLRIGRESKDVHIRGCAEFELAAVAQSRNDASNARKYYRKSIPSLVAAGDSRTIARAMINVGALESDDGQYDAADRILQSAGELVASLHDAELRSAWHGTRGNMFAQSGDFEKAAREYRAALAAGRRARSGFLKLTSYQNLGSVHMDMHKPRLARRWYEKGVSAAAKWGTAEQKMLFHRGAAMACYELNELLPAAAHFEHVRDIASKIGDESAWARATVDLAGTALRSNNPVLACRLLAAARPVLRSDIDRDWLEPFWLNTIRSIEITSSDTSDLTKAANEAMSELPIENHDAREGVLKILAETLLKRRNFDAAAAALRQSLEESRRTGDPKTISLKVAQAGAMLSHSGAHSHAVPFFRRAARRHKRLNDHQGVFKCRNDLGIAYAKLKKFDAATREFSLCLALGKTLRDRVIQARTCMNWGETLRQQGRHLEALPYLRQAVRKYRSLGDLSGEANARANLGLLWYDLGRSKHAHSVFCDAVNLAKQVSDENALAVAFGGLAELARDSGRFGEAARLYRRAIRIELTANDPSHELESQAGLLAAVAGLGREEDAQSCGQRVIELAHILGATTAAAWAFGRAGAAALKRNHDELSVNLFATAIVLGAADQTDAKSILNAMAEEVVRIAIVLRRAEPARLEYWSDLIVARVRKMSGKSIAAIVGQLFEYARAAASRP
ncbi:tetratricopeptide repeat protein [Sorangium sp. So ce1128]